MSGQNLHTNIEERNQDVTASNYNEVLEVQKRRLHGGQKISLINREVAELYAFHVKGDCVIGLGELNASASFRRVYAVLR